MLCEDGRHRRLSFQVCLVLGDARVYGGRLRVAVPEDLLQGKGVDASAIKMGTERVLRAMWVPVFHRTVDNLTRKIALTGESARHFLNKILARIAKISLETVTLCYQTHLNTDSK